MDRMPGARQLANEMTSDESVRTGNPRGHVLDLVTDERIEPAGPVVKALGKREQGLEDMLRSKRGAPQRAGGNLPRQFFDDRGSERLHRIREQIDRALQWSQCPDS